MKKEYITPSLHEINLTREDVITTSNWLLPEIEVPAENTDAGSKSLESNY